MALRNKQMALVVALLTVLALLLASKASVAITCGQVASSLAPCVPYATDKGTLTPGCCDGVCSLNSIASTSADRQAACQCLKSLVSTIPGVDQNAIAGIPDKCGVSVGYPINASTDCNKVH